VEGNRELHWPGVGRERRTCNGEVRLLILNDRILDDLFEFGSEITCKRDQVSDAEHVQVAVGLVDSRCGRMDGILVDDSQMLWNEMRRQWMRVGAMDVDLLTLTRGSPCSGTKWATKARLRVFKPPEEKVR